MCTETPQAGGSGWGTPGRITGADALKQRVPSPRVDAPALSAQGLLAGLLSIALLLSSPCRGADDKDVPANLAPNPGFEVADGNRPAFWEQRTPSDSDRSLQWDEAVSRTDARSVRISNRRSVISRWRTGHMGDLILVPGSACELSD